MQEIFNELIDSYIDSKVGIAQNFLSEPLALQLKKHLISLYTGQHLLSAGIGNDHHAVQNKSVRKDIIYWLDRDHKNKHENDFFDLMDSFVTHLNKTCFTGITGYEFHYTLYEEGSFYKRHLDQFQNNGSRQYSMVMYLNTGWNEGDGGELRIYHEDHLQNIAPVNGKSIFFKSSELEHEVLTTNRPRMSITGWLKVNSHLTAIGNS